MDVDEVDDEVEDEDDNDEEKDLEDLCYNNDEEKSENTPKLNGHGRTDRQTELKADGQDEPTWRPIKTAVASAASKMA